MENKEEILNTETAGDVITSACGLWLHLSILSAIIFIISIFKEESILCSMAAIVSFMACQSYTLRLNLDEKLFKVFYKSQDTTAFDKAVETFFNRNTKQDRSVLSRWYGTKTLFANGILWLLIQIIILCYCIISG